MFDPLIKKNILYVRSNLTKEILLKGLKTISYHIRLIVNKSHYISNYTHLQRDNDTIA